MASRSLNQITQELKSVAPTAAQTRSINNRISQLPSELAAQQKGLEAQRASAFTDIGNRARQRGKGIAAGNIPQAAQARFASDVFAPALASLQGSFNDRRASLQDQLFNIDNQILTQALGVQENEAARAFQAEQNALARQASARATSAAATNDILAKYGLSLDTLGTALGSNTSDEEEAYQQWLNTQLRVTNTPTRSLQSGSGVSLQGGSSQSLQGSSPRLQGGGFSLQGGRSSAAGSGLRVR